MIHAQSQTMRHLFTVVICSSSRLKNCVWPHNHSLIRIECHYFLRFKGWTQKYMCTISQKVPIKLIRNMWSEITILELLPHFPGADELIGRSQDTFMRCRSTKKYYLQFSGTCRDNNRGTKSGFWNGTLYFSAHIKRWTLNQTQNVMSIAKSTCTQCI